jgi:hypothetical protein
MSPSLEPHAMMFSDAVRALQHVLEDSREQWNDAARLAFDRRYAERIMTECKKAEEQLKRLAADLTAAVKALDNIG